MARVTSFGLGEHFTSFVEAQVKEGRYNNASDVMRAALGLLEAAALITSRDSEGAAPVNPVVRPENTMLRNFSA
jgi:putative addiction module CopG family antidote